MTTTESDQLATGFHFGVLEIPDRVRLLHPDDIPLMRVRYHAAFLQRLSHLLIDGRPYSVQTEWDKLSPSSWLLEVTVLLLQRGLAHVGEYVSPSSLDDHDMTQLRILIPGASGVRMEFEPTSQRSLTGFRMLWQRVR